MGNIYKSKIFKKLMLLPLILYCFGVPPVLLGDTIYLKDGSKYSNVIVVVQGKDFLVIFRNGKIKLRGQDKTRRVRIERVNWSHRDKARAFAKSEVSPRKTLDVYNELIRENRRAALWRSGVWPGWGQIYSGHIRKGGLISAAFGLSVCTALGALYRSKAIKTKYARENSLNPRDGGQGTALLLWNWSGTKSLSFLYFLNRTESNQAWNAYHKQRERFVQSMGLTLSLWVLNMLDLFLFPSAPTLLAREPQMNSRFFAWIEPGAQELEAAVVLGVRLWY